MKDRKKPKGTKARVQAYKKKLAYIGHAIIVSTLITVIAVSSFLLYSMLNSPSEQTPINPTLQFQPSNPNPQLKAAIVDHLSLTTPNQTFIETATDILEQAGFTVDYYPGENVTVEFYRNLPTQGYGLIIFRVHTTELGAFFTSELYSTSSYVWEQLNDQIWKVSYHGDPPLYFGISPSFVKSCMNGRFKETVVIAMGCYSLKFNDMAKAFIEKGARVYVGWTGSVLGSHTDIATVYLLQHLLLGKYTVRNAIVQTIEEVGPDPAYEHESVLLALPEEAWDYTIKTP